MSVLILYYGPPTKKSLILDEFVIAETNKPQVNTIKTIPLVPALSFGTCQSTARLNQQFNSHAPAEWAQVPCVFTI